MTKNEQPKRVSDEALIKATGKDWASWFRILHSLDASKMSHKKITTMLMQDGLLEPGKEWWAQGITVAYEFEIGRRVTGETADAGFNIGVQRTLSIVRQKLWDYLISPEGRALWLGGESNDFKLEKGAQFSTENGTRGELRTVSEPERLRLIYHPTDWEEPSTLQLTLNEKDGKTALRFHHERLSGPEARAAMKTHWGEVLDRIRTALDA